MYRLYSMIAALLLLAGCSAMGLGQIGQTPSESAQTSQPTFEAERQALFEQPFIDPLTDYLIEHGADPDRTQVLAKVRQERDRRCQAVAGEYAEQPPTPANLRQFNAGYAYSCPQQVTEFEARVEAQPQSTASEEPTGQTTTSPIDAGQSQAPDDGSLTGAEDSLSGSEGSLSQAEGFLPQAEGSISDEARSNCYLLTTIRNFSAAQEACQAPAEKGDVRAQANLARVSHAFKDYETALKWANRAAPQSASAAFLLGQMYANGRGVTQNPQQAAHWYAEAAKLGSEEAQAELERLPNDPHEKVADTES